MFKELGPFFLVKWLEEDEEANEEQQTKRLLKTRKCLVPAPSPRSPKSETRNPKPEILSSQRESRRKSQRNSLSLDPCINILRRRTAHGARRQVTPSFPPSLTPCHPSLTPSRTLTFLPHTLPAQHHALSSPLAFGNGLKMG